MACRRSVVSTARDQHRRLDRDFADAEARDGGGADGTSDIARPRRWKTDTVSGGRNEPKVLLMTMSERVSRVRDWLAARQRVYEPDGRQ
jgi:hypothetical protein